MMLIDVLLDWLVPAAHAVRIDTLGTSANGVALMWADIMSVLPFGGLATTATAPVEFFGAKVLRFISSLITVCAVLVIIYAGIRMIISRGEDEGYSAAKQLLLYAVMGLVFGMVAAVAINYAVIVYQGSIF